MKHLSAFFVALFSIFLTSSFCSAECNVCGSLSPSALPGAGAFPLAGLLLLLASQPNLLRIIVTVGVSVGHRSSGVQMFFLHRAKRLPSGACVGKILSSTRFGGQGA